jgi:hypothetical protein
MLVEMERDMYLVSTKVLNARLSCIVSTTTLDGAMSVSVVSDSMFWSSTGSDFEEALVGLRLTLESDGLVLLCNRFRRNALTTPMCRQMSDGLSCYLVRPFESLNPDFVVDALGSADESDVCTLAESERFLEKWKAWFELPWPARGLAKLLK